MPAGQALPEQSLIQKLIAARKGSGSALGGAAGAGGMDPSIPATVPQQQGPYQPYDSQSLGGVVGDMTNWDTLTQGMSDEDKKAFVSFLSNLPQVHTAFDQVKP